MNIRTFLSALIYFQTPPPPIFNNKESLLHPGNVAVSVNLVSSALSLSVSRDEERTLETRWGQCPIPVSHSHQRLHV